MSNTEDKLISRKEFISKLVSALILGVLVFIPVFLISNKRVARKAAACDKDIQCSNCSKSTNCNLIKEE